MKSKNSERHSYRAAVRRKQSFGEGLFSLDVTGNRRLKVRHSPNVQVSFYNVGVFLRRGLQALSDSQEDSKIDFKDKDLQTF